MRQNAFALRGIFGALQEVSLDEICGETIESEPATVSVRSNTPGLSGDRCDGCRRAVPLVCAIDMPTAETARGRRRYCAECAKLIGDWRPSPQESA
jgi:hypothetical protein